MVVETSCLTQLIWLEQAVERSRDRIIRIRTDIMRNTEKSCSDFKGQHVFYGNNLQNLPPCFEITHGGYYAVITPSVDPYKSEHFMCFHSVGAIISGKLLRMLPICNSGGSSYATYLAVHSSISDSVRYYSSEALKRPSNCSSSKER